MQTFTEIQFSTPDKNINEVIIALLAGEGFEGFDETGKETKAYISSEKLKGNSLDSVRELFPEVIFTENTIEEKNWNEQWESSFEPVIVSDFAAVRAGFHEPISSVKHDLIITPKMSFGTGHHATTSLVITLMEEVDFKNKTVLDFGTGTGVLAILAEKCGATNIIAIDNDDWSIANTRENIVANNCIKINVFKAEKIDPEYRADVILANINLNVLKQNVKAIVTCCGVNGMIIFSGLLVSDRENFLELLKTEHLKTIQVKDKNGWIAIKAQYIEGERVVAD